MALQVTKTNSNGLTVSYWRVSNFSVIYDDSWLPPSGNEESFATGQLCRFDIQGYHDADYRATNASVEGSQYVLTGSEYTSTISNSSGDLRGALYDWLKTSNTTPCGASTLPTGFFHSATDI